MAIDKEKARKACVALTKLDRKQYHNALRILHQMAQAESEWAEEVLNIWYLGGFINSDEVSPNDSD